MAILMGLMMLFLPWAADVPASTGGKILVSMVGFFVIIGTIFLFIATFSVHRD